MPSDLCKLVKKFYSSMNMMTDLSILSSCNLVSMHMSYHCQM